MYEIDISSSGGYGLRATSYEDDEFFRKGAFDTPCQLDRDIWALNASGDIAGFKDKWRITKIHELYLGPCGVHQFQIENDEFVSRNGSSLAEHMRELQILSSRMKESEDEVS